MRSMEPPKSARWFLQHLGCSPNNTAVIGDLDERYRHGRSRTWYWSQVVKAIAIGLVQEVRLHKLNAVRAIVTGWTLLLAGGFLFRTFVIRVNTLLRFDPDWHSSRFN